MGYYRAKERENDHEAAYRLYTAKAQEIIVKSVAGVAMTDFAELIELKPVDNRTGDEIAADVMKRAGLHFGGGE